MRKNEFREWLDGKIKNRPIGDCISRCNSVEKKLGVDLDEEYRKDQGASLFQRMQYTIKDERAGSAAPEGFDFKSGVNIRFRMTDLRSAVKRYFIFCAENGD